MIQTFRKFSLTTVLLTFFFVIYCLMNVSLFMAGMSLGKTATPADSDLVATMFGSLGKIHVVDERLLNAVTGVRYISFPTLDLLLMKIFCTSCNKNCG